MALSTPVPDSQHTKQTKKLVTAGVVASALPVLFLAFDAALKLAHPAVVTEANARLGYPDDSALGLGLVLLACVILYMVRRTQILGAILLTGYLGGAVATHVRIGDPLISHTLFPVYVGALLWLGLWLREPRLRAMVPLREPPAA